MSTDKKRTEGRPPTREFSAGGVVLRSDADRDGAEVLVIVPRGSRNLALPKGGADEGETLVQAATREVREETGVTAEPMEELGDVRYWYSRKRRRIFKTVTFWRFEYRSGDTADHDHEVEDARWVPVARARRELSFPGEREMLERAVAALDR